jgi:hypothetical protein
MRFQSRRDSNGLPNSIDAEDNLWLFELPDGRGMKRHWLSCIHLFWTEKLAYPPDVMYYEQWPVRHPSLLFGGMALSEPKYIELWKTLNPDPKEDEIIRNYPIRQPLLWLTKLRN